MVVTLMEPRFHNCPEKGLLCEDKSANVNIEASKQKVDDPSE